MVWENNTFHDLPNLFQVSCGSPNYGLIFVGLPGASDGLCLDILSLEVISNTMTQIIRQRLDQLFAFDACSSAVFGVLALLAPHGVLQQLGGGFYNHSVHETLR